MPTATIFSSFSRDIKNLFKASTLGLSYLYYHIMKIQNRARYSSSAFAKLNIKIGVQNVLKSNKNVDISAYFGRFLGTERSDQFDSFS